MVEGNVTLLRREFSLYVTEPSHPQLGNAIDNLADLFRGVFRLFYRGRHGAPSRDGSRRSKKPQQSELGGGDMPGLLIFETQTHPATTNATIDARIRFHRPCQHRLPAGQRHGRTNPLAEVRTIVGCGLQ